MKRIEALEKKREILGQEIAANLDLLIGSVCRSPSMSGHSLTTKAGGKTVTLYVRKSLVGRAQAMTERHRKVQDLLGQLSRVNWDLLQARGE